MAIFKHRLTKQQIEEEYTHYARLYGLVPVYFNIESNCMAVRNWLPDWLFDVGDCLFDMYVTVVQLTTDPYFEPDFPVLLVKEIKPKEEGDETKVD